MWFNTDALTKKQMVYCENFAKQVPYWYKSARNDVRLFHAHSCKYLYELVLNTGIPRLLAQHTFWEKKTFNFDRRPVMQLRNSTHGVHIFYDQLFVCYIHKRWIQTYLPIFISFFILSKILPGLHGTHKTYTNYASVEYSTSSFIIWIIDHKTGKDKSYLWF